MTQTTFDQRVATLEKKHHRLSDGVTYRIGPDGLITAHPHRRFSPRLPARGMLLLLAGTFAFKAALFVASGEGAYEERLAELAQGRAVERAVAWVMQPDAATRAVATAVTALTHRAGAGLP